MDTENAHQFQPACQQWIAKGKTHIVVELSDLQYVTSIGLSSFMAVAKSLQPKSICNWRVMGITQGRPNECPVQIGIETYEAFPEESVSNICVCSNNDTIFTSAVFVRFESERYRILP